MGMALVSMLSGCALITSLKGQPAVVQVQTILSDAQWGVAAAHSQLWLSDQDYAYAYQAINAAEDAVKASPNGAKAVAKSILVDAERVLPADSKLRPYFDAAIILLN